MIGLEQYVSSEGRFHGNIDFNCFDIPPYRRKKQKPAQPYSSEIVTTITNQAINTLSSKIEELMASSEIILAKIQELSDEEAWRGQIVINGGSASEVFMEGADT